MTKTKYAEPIRGLNEKEVLHSRKIHGANEITQKKRIGFFRRFISEFNDPIIKILMIALAANLLIMLRHHSNLFESIGIAAAVFLATLVSTLSEYGSELAFQKLQEEALTGECRVKRGNDIKSIPIGEIVVGDIIFLQAGDKVPADGIMISGELMVDQSALNGESNEKQKRPGTDTGTTDLMNPSRVFRGTVITSGEGIMQVTSVGDNTFYGRMASEVQEESRESPLKVRLSKLAGTISKLGYFAAVLVVLADLFNLLVINGGYYTLTLGTFIEHLLHAITLGITVVVVAVPEGLPMMITVVLSSNMFRMLRDNVMVRKLVGIETAGSMNILFTDKTGTLTKGMLEARSFILADGKTFKSTSSLSPALRELFEISCALNNSATMNKNKPIGGNSTDRALLKFIHPAKFNPKKYERAAYFPFDSSKKYSKAIVSSGKKQFVLIKGAPEKILNCCSFYYNENCDVIPFDNKNIAEKIRYDLMKKAIRVIALAVSDKDCDSLDNLIFLGFVGIRDEVRLEAKKAIREISAAGIQVVMITGDSKETAAAIAAECGLLKDIRKDRVITSQELSQIDDDTLKVILPKLCVVARALPNDKTRLVRVAQEMGLVAGMTGDGINDAPALKRADIGFAMGSGTEVAKEAGDIVILDDNISSIEKAILYGRTIFKSIRKFIIFQLTMNLCAVGISLICPFIGIENPVTVIQMLWINIIMDTLAGLAFAGEAPLSEYMKERPKRRDEPVLCRAMIFQIISMGIYTIILCIAFLKLDAIRTLFRESYNDTVFLTAFFALFIFCGIFNCFNARTHRINILSHLIANKSFIFIMLFVSAVQLLIIYFGGSLFRCTGLTLNELKTVLYISASVIPVDLLRKTVMRLNNHEGAL